MCLRSLQIKWRFNKVVNHVRHTYLRHGLLLCHYTYHLHAMQSRHLESNKTCNSYGKQCNWQSMQVIKSVFIRKFHTQHNVLVHSTDYLCNENAQYVPLLTQKDKNPKNPVDQELIHHGLCAEEVGHALCAAKNNLLFPGYYKFYYG